MSMTVLPRVLSDHLPDYAPGRIRPVAIDAWPVAEVHDRAGVPSSIPRYALEVHTARLDIDPDRVRWLVERSTVIRPLDARHVHLVPGRGGLYVVDGHHALAAHLAIGSDRIPVRLVHAA